MVVREEVGKWGVVLAGPDALEGELICEGRNWRIGGAEIAVASRERWEHRPNAREATRSHSWGDSSTLPPSPPLWPRLQLTLLEKKGLFVHASIHIYALSPAPIKVRWFHAVVDCSLTSQDPAQFVTCALNVRNHASPNNPTLYGTITGAPLVAGTKPLRDGGMDFSKKPAVKAEVKKEVVKKEVKKEAVKTESRNEIKAEPKTEPKEKPAPRVSSTHGNHSHLAEVVIKQTQDRRL